MAVAACGTVSAFGCWRNSFTHAFDADLLQLEVQVEDK